MSLKHHLKMWFPQKIWSKPDKSHSEETVALPEVHTGKVRLALQFPGVAVCTGVGATCHR